MTAFIGKPRSASVVRRWQTAYAVRAIACCLLLWMLAICVPAYAQARAAARALTRPASAVAAAGSSVSVPPQSPARVRYNQYEYALYFIGVVWQLLGLWLLLQTRASSRLRAALEARVRRRFWQAAAYYAAFSLAMELWSLPLMAIGYAIERRYGFSTEGAPLWLGDRALGYLLGLQNIVAVWLGYLLLERQPRRWWVWLWLVSIPFTLLDTVLWPVVIAPVYNRFEPMPAGPLRDRLEALAERAHVGRPDIYVVDISRRTTKLNAYVTGLGPTKRIVIWDTTLKALTPDEVVAITGHEMGHYVLGHNWQDFGAGVLGAFVLLWLLSLLLPAAVRRCGARWGVRSQHDLAGLPLVMLLLDTLLFLQSPAACALSRYHEHAADRYGLALTHLNVPMARAFAAFVAHDYADPDPPAFIEFWVGTHPPLRDRIEYALSFRASGQ